MTKYADGVLSVSTVHNIPGLPPKKYSDREIERAMSDAVRGAVAEGIALDSDEMRRRMKAARRKVTHAGF